MLQTPLLSIIVAIYNGEKFLAPFFDYIRQQALDSYELILVNDGSTDRSAGIIDAWKDKFPQVIVINQENQGVSVARNSGLARASGKYVTFPDIDDVIYPDMYRTLLTMAEENQLDVVTCNGRYVYDYARDSHPIFPPERLSSTPVLPGYQWLKKALDSRKFLHVTWLNIYRHAFITEHGFTFEPGLRHQDIPWTTEVLLAAGRVQYTDKMFYDYLIHAESVSHKQGGDETEICSAHHYMKILRMLDDINRRYPDKVKQIPACHWQIAKEGLGILHTINNIVDQDKKKALVKELFENGTWRLIWDNARGFRLRWRLARRYPKLKKLAGV